MLVAHADHAGGSGLGLVGIFLLALVFVALAVMFVGARVVVRRVRGRAPSELRVTSK